MILCTTRYSIQKFHAINVTKESQCIYVTLASELISRLSWQKIPVFL